LYVKLNWPGGSCSHVIVPFLFFLLRVVEGRRLLEAFDAALNFCFYWQKRLSCVQVDSALNFCFYWQGGLHVYKLLQKLFIYFPACSIAKLLQLQSYHNDLAQLSVNLDILALYFFF
jgi:hypothetical protein